MARLAWLSLTTHALQQARIYSSFSHEDIQMIMELVCEMESIPLEEVRRLGRLCEVVSQWHSKALDLWHFGSTSNDVAFYNLTQQVAIYAEIYGIDPSVLIEVGFHLSNSNNGRMLVERDKLLEACAIAEKIERLIVGQVVDDFELRPYRHSENFTSVFWRGVTYVFTPMQAACIRALWEASENGTHELKSETILERAGSRGNRLRDVFKNHAAWKKLIIESKKGIYRLAEKK